MKFYNLDTEFTFGKFEGKTLSEVVELQPSYLNWCSTNLDHFYISDEVLEEISTIKPDFHLTQESINSLKQKHDKWENEQEDDEDQDAGGYQYTDRDTFDALTDGTQGDYDDWRDGGGDLDSLMEGMGY
jgi:hypothetical protein